MRNVPRDVLIDFAGDAIVRYMVIRLPYMTIDDRALTKTAVRELLSEQDPVAVTLETLYCMAADLTQDFIENQLDNAEGNWNE